ncbi:MAG: FAD-binding oxidoreductase [Thermaerobacter sp.]|nr:FAD-binding oxidoreductase [Thermaerobacter sp.]
MSVYWQAGIRWTPPRPDALPATFDVAVLGAGLTGLAAALAMGNQGLSVLVVDRGRVGDGASGRNGGQVLTGLNPSYRELRRTGGASARSWWAEGAAAVADVAALVDRHHIACDWHPGGHLAVAASPRRWRRLLADAALLQADGFPLDVLDAGAVADRLGWPGYVGALFDPASATVNPYRLTVGVAQAALDAGAVIVEETASRIEAARSGTFLVRAGDAAVTVGRVLVATNAFLPRSVPGFAGHVRRVDSPMLATAPLPGAFVPRLLAGRPAVFEESRRTAHFQLTPDGRLVFGSRLPAGTPSSPATLGAVLRRLLPGLEGIPVDHFWHGPLAITATGLPILGETPRGVRWVGGYSGHGVALAVRLGTAAGRWMSNDRRPAWPEPFPVGQPTPPATEGRRCRPPAPQTGETTL